MTWLVANDTVCCCLYWPIQRRSNARLAVSCVLRPSATAQKVHFELRRCYGRDTAHACADYKHARTIAWELDQTLLMNASTVVMIRIAVQKQIFLARKWAWKVRDFTQIIDLERVCCYSSLPLSPCFPQTSAFVAPNAKALYRIVVWTLLQTPSVLLIVFSTLHAQRYMHISLSHLWIPTYTIACIPSATSVSPTCVVARAK